MRTLMTLAITAGLCATQAFAAAEGNPPSSTPANAQENKGTLLHPKVDKPIPDTYEPLNGTREEDRDVGTDPIHESWDMKKKQKERAHDEKAKAEEENKNAPPLQKDIPIQESVPQPPPKPAPAPTVEKDKGSLRIHDQ